MTDFLPLAQLADQLAAEASRLQKRAGIAAAIAAVHRATPHSGDAGLFALYLAGQPFAEADPRKLNAGGALLTRAVKAVTGCSDAALTAAYRRHGDLGAAAAAVWPDRPGSAADPVEGPDASPPDGLSLTALAAAFDTMATARTTAVRTTAVEGLLRRASALEAKYLLKLMLGDMRIGVKQSLIEEAIAVAASGAGAAVEVAAVRHAVMLEADLAGAVGRAFAGTLGAARMRLFHPLGFMLASPVETPEEAIERFTPKPAKALKPAKPARRKRPGKAESAAAFEDLGEVARVAPGAGLVDEPGAGLPAAVATTGEKQVLRCAQEDKGWGVGAQEDGESWVGAQEDEEFGEDAQEDKGWGVGVQEDERFEGDAQVGKESEAAASADGVGGFGVQALLEDKYDGMRAQLHCGDPAQPGRVAIYSRNREDITGSFPELAEAFAGVREPVILDGEILGWNQASDTALPFAVLGQRIGRKRVDDALRRQIPVVFMAFDLLFATATDTTTAATTPTATTGATTTAAATTMTTPTDTVTAGAGGEAELLLSLPLRERRTLLEAVTVRLQPVTTAPLECAAQPAQAGLFALPAAGSADPPMQRLRLSPAVLVASAAAIDTAYADARARANEGVMVKAAGSAYLPGRRGLAWVKLKRELATLDVVITGAEFGSGRRAGLLSDYTFAVRGPSAAGQPAELLNVGKAYSGVTDAEIAELTAWLQAHTLEDTGHFRTVEPLRVLEVAFNNIMRSERHASGFALRFPRILRVRDDKPVAEIDTLARVEEIFQSQPDKPAAE